MTARHAGQEGRVPGAHAWAFWKEGCAWSPRLGLPEGSGQRDRGPVDAGATRGLGHSWDGRGGWVGWGRNNLTSLLVRPSALICGSHWLNPPRSRAEGSLGTERRTATGGKRSLGQRTMSPQLISDLTALCCLQPRGREGQGPHSGKPGALATQPGHWVTASWVLTGTSDQMPVYHFQLQGLHCSSSNAIISCPALMVGKSINDSNLAEKRANCYSLKNGYYRFSTNIQQAGDI